MPSVIVTSIIVLITIMGPSVTACAPRFGEAAQRLVAAIALLEVAEETERRNYVRERFGTWSDLRGSGCTTREEVLVAQALGRVQRDLVDPCTIVAADWYSPFDGRRISGPPSEVHIDHVVSLAEAWDSGAALWTAAERLHFANDRLNLVVSSVAANRDKSDGDMADWRPDRADAWCAAATMTVLTKLRHGLWLDPAERGALVDMARGCDRSDRVVIGGIPLPGSAGFEVLVAQILDERARGASAVGGS